MPSQSDKTQTLRDNGYVYNFDRMMYINHTDKKAFSYEFIDDNPESEIKKRIQERPLGQDWRFYTTMPMSEGTVKELKRVLQ